MGQFVSHSTDFGELLYLNIFQNSVKKFQDSLKSYKNNENFTWRPMYFYDSVSLNSFRNEKYFIQNLLRKPKHFVFNNLFPLTSCRLWANVQKYCRAGEATDYTIWRMRFACWITKATNAPSYCFSAAIIVTRKCFCYVCTHIVCLVVIKRREKLKERERKERKERRETDRCVATVRGSFPTHTS